MGNSHGPQTETRGDNQRRDCNAPTDSNCQPGCNGETGGGQQVGTDSQNWVRGDSDRPRSTTTGGMLRQLIAEEEDQLAEIDAEVVRLQQKREKSQTRCNQYKAMLDELEKRASQFSDE